MWDKVKSLNSKRKKNSLTKRHAMKGNGTRGQEISKGKSPNNFKALVSNPKEILSKKTLF
jgi:hypothetical protein